MGKSKSASKKNPAQKRVNKAAVKKIAPKKAAVTKPSPKKTSSKKATLTKAALKKAAVKKVAGTKIAPKRVASKKNPVKPVIKKAELKKGTSASVKSKVSVQASLQPVKKKATAPLDYAQVVTPLGERLVVRAVQAEKMTAGGLYIPDTVDTKERYVKATVLAAGNGAKNKKGQVKPLDVKVGDMILFPAHTSVRIQFNSEELHIVNESDVLGTV